MLINFFLEIIPIYKILPEIWLFISILFLVIFNFIFGEQFDHLYSIFFYLYCVISLLITLILLIIIYKFSLVTNLENDFILLNFKIYFMKILVLTLSKICLILFRYSLTEKSETSCIFYFVFYLSSILICLITISINSLYINYLFCSFEILSFFFYILASFNYNNFAYLKFRPLRPRKLLYLSFFSGFIGLVLFESHFCIWSYNLSKHTEVLDYFLILVNNNEYILICSIFFLILSLLLKLTTYYFPTYYIYYKKTPLITIIYIHLIPKAIFLYFLVELIFTNFYFNILKNYLTLLLISVSLCCLVIGIGMRRLFLKHFLENLALVNTGYLLLCLTPLTFESLNYCIYFYYYYILTILLYGGIASFFDNELNPGKRISFDTILADIEKKDYVTIVSFLIIFLFCGMPPTRRDYPCSRGIPFNGLFFQWILLNSLISANFYLISFFLIIFNWILFLFFFWTIFPFWFHERKNQKLDNFPKYFNIFMFEFLIYYIIFVVSTLLIFSNSVILNFLKSFYLFV